MMKVGVVGCGDISSIYLRNMIDRFPYLEVVGCCAATFSNAVTRAGEFGIRAMTLDEMLGSSETELIVNLTPPCVHAEIIERALDAGKHVYTEKVIAPSYGEAERLADLADKRGLCLCSAPDTFLGDSLQAARRLLDGGLIGEVTSCHANINRQMGFFYEFLEFTTQPGGGIGYDLGIYYLTALLSLLGPVAETFGQIVTSRPVRVNRKEDSPHFGETYTVRNENLMVASLRFRSGVLGTLHFNGDSVMPENPYFAVFGTKGILYLNNPDCFGGDLHLMSSGSESQEPGELLREIPVAGLFSDNCRGAGVAEMADAISHGRKPRTDCRMAVHAVEVLDGIVLSGTSGKVSPLHSSLEKPAPLDGPADWMPREN